MTSRAHAPRGPAAFPGGLLRRGGAIAALVALASIMTTACSPAAGDDDRRLLLGHGAAPGNPRSLAADFFSERLAESTEGRLKVQVLGQEQIGSDSEMMVSVASGTLDMSVNSQGPFSPIVPEVNLVGLPFLFESSEHAYEVIDGEVGDYLAERAEERGYHVLAWWDNGVRDITNSVRPIKTPEDLQGLQIRTPDDPMTIDIFAALGASPTPMDFGELYLGLRQSAVDGRENPVVNVKSSALQEVQNHLAVTGHKYELNPFVISTQTWATLSVEDQELIEQTAREARDYQRQQMLEQTDQIYQEFEDVLEITRPDRAAFRAVTKSVYDEWAQKYPEFYQFIAEAADASRDKYTEVTP